MDAASTAASYARDLDDTCSVTRGATTVSPVRCRIIDYKAADLVNGIVAGDRHAILLASDIVEGGITLPLRKADYLMWSDGGSTLKLTVQATSAPRKVGTVTVAIDAQVRGM